MNNLFRDLFLQNLQVCPNTNGAQNHCFYGLLTGRVLPVRSVLAKIVPSRMPVDASHTRSNNTTKIPRTEQTKSIAVTEYSDLITAVLFWEEAMKSTYQRTTKAAADFGYSKECPDRESSPVAAGIMFTRGVLSCLKYLEAVPWSEDEEEKLKSLFTRYTYDKKPS
ncbi:hypothetical protein C5167_021262 [Papaver somniferum]|uniref:Uncharacterized protein n=1 Tax=Papaver somniferum TaxID=3469 RepID=A0A4Y7IZC4_PAPSO|nr:hypothetical protein C5167_021262 [Papaver somniferum]